MGYGRIVSVLAPVVCEHGRLGATLDERGETTVRRLLLLGTLLALCAIALGSPGVASAKCGPKLIEDLPGLPAAPFLPAALSGCQGPLPPEPDAIFLCYSKFQVLPGVWPHDVAADLLAAGYWYPNAVPGNVDGGPNLGAYHLVCNATGTATGDDLNLNGEVVSAAYADDNLGYYPIVKSA